MPPEMISRMRRPCSTTTLRGLPREYMVRRAAQGYHKRWQAGERRVGAARLAEPGTILATGSFPSWTVPHGRRTDPGRWRVRGSHSRGRPGAVETAARARGALPGLRRADP